MREAAASSGKGRVLDLAEAAEAAVLPKLAQSPSGTFPEGKELPRHGHHQRVRSTYRSYARVREG